MVRRQARKDPGHSTRRAGLPLCVSIFLLAVQLPSDCFAQSAQGPTSKTARVEAPSSEAGPVHFNLNFLPWRKSSAARQTVESAVARARPARAPEPVARGTSYLPAGGSIPLRFASARTWPDRMTPADEAALAVALASDPDLAIRRDQLLAQHAAGVPAVPTVTPNEAPDITITASSADAAESREPQIINRPMLYGMGEAVLTSDMVLRSLDNISTEKGAVPQQFQPAVRRDGGIDSVPPATAP